MDRLFWCALSVFMLLFSNMFVASSKRYLLIFFSHTLPYLNCSQRYTTPSEGPGVRQHACGSQVYLTSKSISRINIPQIKSWKYRKQFSPGAVFWARTEDAVSSPQNVTLGKKTQSTGRCTSCFLSCHPGRQGDEKKKVCGNESKGLNLPKPQLDSTSCAGLLEN